MANQISPNIYEINGVTKSTVQKFGFPVAGIETRPYLGASTTGQLYGEIITSANGYVYAVAETVAQLATLAG